MKLHSQLTKTATKDFQQILDLDTFNALKSKLMQEKSRETYKSKNSLNDTIDIKTPSTVDTTLRSRGSAISKSMRPDSRSKGKVRPSILSRPSLNTQNAVTKYIRENQEDKQDSVKSQIIGESAILSRKVLTDRAVYYGDVELPYLHSSDAISSLYQRPRNQQKSSQQPLINPPPSISPYILTSLKNLYLYYTPIDSLRQLGTGWSNLKSLTIMCSHQLVDLAGLSIFPSLQYLFVPHNNIREISDLMYHSTLRCIDLMDNRIDLMDQIQYLYTVNLLEWVDVSQNPVTLVKEKYRILCENLGNKMQMEDCNKPFQYQLSQLDLDYQIYSYQKIEISNNLIKQINEQIVKEEIKIGDHWRKVREKLASQPRQQTKQNDIQIIESFDCQSEDQDVSQNSMQKDHNKLTLRVTALTQYIQPTLSIAPLKKYFQNKVCPQSKQEKEKESPKVGEDQHKQESADLGNRKFAATQKVSIGAVSEQKKRLTSVSVRKKVGKLSLSKNGNFASTASSVLMNLKTKQQFSDANMNGLGVSSNLKFLGKRRLLNKLSQQVAQ